MKITNDVTTPDELNDIASTIRKNEDIFMGKYAYTIEISTPVLIPNTTKPQNTNAKTLLRSLMNAKMSLSGIDNRRWFKSNFPGGIYKVIIEQNESESIPVVRYILCCVSDHDNLDFTMINSFHIRARKIVPVAVVLMSRPYKIDNVDTFLKDITKVNNRQSTIHFNSPHLGMVDNAMKRWILSVLGADIQCFGTLYNLMK